VVSSSSSSSKRRARSDDDKEIRRNHILTTAKSLWSIHTFTSFTMNELAEQANLAKGTLYLYFKTKEEVLLALLSEALTQWFEILTEALAAGTDQLTPQALATLLVESFVASGPLDRLLPIAASILEHNIGNDTIVQYKTLLLTNLAALSIALNARVHYLSGQADVFLTQVYGIAAGFSQMADPAPPVAELLNQPIMAPLRLDFAPMARATLETLLLGYQSTWQNDQNQGVA
jgi:AcrR family transcriptional regulator